MPIIFVEFILLLRVNKTVGMFFLLLLLFLSTVGEQSLSSSDEISLLYAYNSWKFNLDSTGNTQETNTWFPIVDK